MVLDCSPPKTGKSKHLKYSIFYYNWMLWATNGKGQPKMDFQNSEATLYSQSAKHLKICLKLQISSYYSLKDWLSEFFWCSVQMFDLHHYAHSSTPPHAGSWRYCYSCNCVPKKPFLFGPTANCSIGMHPITNASFRRDSFQDDILSGHFIHQPPPPPLNSMNPWLLTSHRKMSNIGFHSFGKTSMPCSESEEICVTLKINNSVIVKVKGTVVN